MINHDPRASLPPRAGATPISGMAGRPRPIAGLATLLPALSAALVEAQPRPAEVHARVGTAIFFEAAQHVSAGVSYRHYFGASGWALEPEYSFMTEGSHQDHIVILNFLAEDISEASSYPIPYAIGARIAPDYAGCPAPSPSQAFPALSVNYS